MQPLRRFRGPKAMVNHPRVLLNPTATSPDEWALFWLHPRQTIFPLLLGLKLLSPYAAQPSGSSMTPDDWTAWVGDVLWGLSQIILQ